MRTGIAASRPESRASLRIGHPSYKVCVRSWNLAATGLSLWLTGVLLGYAFLENFGTQVHL
jgi:hypothetical protein